MLIKDLFAADVTRDIPPVVYFHEQDPKKLKVEVDEYIITGGYPEGDPRAARVKNGIHEQFVRLLQNMLREMKKNGGPDLPASWISGFYGSGKSSFAKLLGLALDNRQLPDGSSLAEALLRRDDTPRAAEFREAWESLRAQVDPVAVVFDIGGVARDNEHIHTAVVRQVQARLGYCKASNLVADFELKLELDGRWTDFLNAAETTLKRSWQKAKDEQQADDHFSHVMHVLDPERYVDPMSWIDARAGSQTGAGSSVSEATQSIKSMMEKRAAGKTLFIVVDEVSQYISQDDNRMLKLQSFVADLGQKLHGKVWLLVTGQEKLDEADSQKTVISKLKDRFPPALRVHLAATNIRDVVHRRLLKKAPAKEPTLRELFQQHRPDLKLYAYGCDDITEEDFVEVYPMLPSQVDLLLRITTALRSRSTRIQGDDHAIRGLLQLLGELFRAQKLADRPVGDIVTLDAIYEVQQSALDSDVQTSLAHVFNHAVVTSDPLATRIVKAVALLELIQDSEPTTAELVARCLYSRMGQGSGLQSITDALERLRSANLLGYSEKHGYKVQSSAGQEWQRERDDIGVTPEQISELIQEKLKFLVATPERPRLKNQPFPWSAFYSDSRQAKDERLVDPRTEACFSVDFRFVNTDERQQAEWIKRSSEQALENRLVWVVGEAGSVSSLARELKKSQRMMERYKSRAQSLSVGLQRLLLEETTNEETLGKKLGDAVAEAFLNGTMYFKGEVKIPRQLGNSFVTALHTSATQVLPFMYPHFTETAVTNTELLQLLEPTLAGPSNKFFEGGLGILTLDAGKYVATCSGQIPAGILRFIEESKGSSGSTLIGRFSRPPYGYPVDVIKACLAGLLRASKIRVHPLSGPDITSVRDPGARDLFTDRELRAAEIYPAANERVSARDRNAICKFFETRLNIQLDRENDAIADSVYAQFPGRREQLRGVEARFERLPNRPPMPQVLEKLGSALENCRRSRQVEETVFAVKQHLDALNDGFEQLGIFQTELTDEAIAQVNEAANVREHQLVQLEQIPSLPELDDVREDAQRIREHLGQPRPWRDVASLKSSVERIRSTYVTVRKGILSYQGAELDAARARVKARDGFTKLTAEQAHRVLRPFIEAQFDTTPEAVAPTLVDLRDRFVARLSNAEEAANDVLDKELNTGVAPTPVMKVESNISGREVASPEQLDALLDDLENRIRPLLEKGVRVRIV
jgi:uncharacterized protein (DUF2267 family)